MKIVAASRKQEDAKEMYKVGNVIYDGNDYYLVITSDKGYALINLSNDSVFMEEISINALANACWSGSDKLVDAELTIIK